MVRSQSSSKWVESLGQIVHSLGCQVHVLLRHGSGKYKSVLISYTPGATSWPGSHSSFPAPMGKAAQAPCTPWCRKEYNIPKF